MTYQLNLTKLTAKDISHCVLDFNSKIVVADGAIKLLKTEPLKAHTAILHQQQQKQKKNCYRER